jgi:hypothetical protein
MGLSDGRCSASACSAQRHSAPESFVNTVARDSGRTSPSEQPEIPATASMPQPQEAAQSDGRPNVSSWASLAYGDSAPRRDSPSATSTRKGRSPRVARDGAMLLLRPVRTENAARRRIAFSAARPFFPLKIVRRTKPESIRFVSYRPWPRWRLGVGYRVSAGQSGFSIFQQAGPLPAVGGFRSAGVGRVRC